MSVDAVSAAGIVAGPDAVPLVVDDLRKQYGKGIWANQGISFHSSPITTLASVLVRCFGRWC